MRPDLVHTSMHTIPLRASNRLSPLQVPVVDLSQSDEDVLKTLKRACKGSGFFYGVPCPLYIARSRSSAAFSLA